MNTRFKVFASYNILQYLRDFIHVLIFVIVSKCRKSPKLTNIVICACCGHFQFHKLIWPLYLRYTSHMRFKAHDHFILRSLIGQKGWDRPSSRHIRRWRLKGLKKLPSWMKCLHKFLHGRLYVMFHAICIESVFRGSLDINSGRPCQNQGPYTAGAAFGWESGALTITWSRPWLVCEVALRL
jgi:hypothetical protein